MKHGRGVYNCRWVVIASCGFHGGSPRQPSKTFQIDKFCIMISYRCGCFANLKKLMWTTICKVLVVFQ